MRKCFAFFLLVALLFAMPWGAQAQQSPFIAALAQDYGDISDDMDYWPETRWWLAQALNTDETLKAGVRELYEAGFRSVEILQLTDNGIADNAAYGWGSQAWKNDMLVLCQQLNEHGMGVGLTSGPAWMPAIEIDPNEDGALMDLAFSAELVQGGTARSGALAKPEVSSEAITRQTFVAVVAARKTQVRPVTTVTQGPFGATESTADITFVQGDFIDLTSQVTVTTDAQGDDTAILDWIAPGDGEYLLFSYWMRGSASAETSSYVTMYNVNHFDVAGPQAQIAYWEENVFSGGLLEVLENIAQTASVDFFQDSLEIQSATGQFWARDFLEQFERRRGYSLVPYLPIVSSIAGTMTTEYGVDGDQQLTQMVLNDLRQTMTDLYEECYLQPIKEWLNGRGFNLRAQVTYGKTMEISLPVRSVDVPETETLAMENVLDGYRMQSGAAHLYGKAQFSSETGAVFFGSYSTTLQDYLYMMNSQFAGGVNRTIFHGYASIAGPEETTSWPGYDGGTKIDTIVSDRWGRRMPFWDDVTDLTGYLTRAHKVLQSGQPRMDVAMLNLEYDHQNLDGLVGGTVEKDTDGYYWQDLSLQAAGYAYEFLAPQMLEDGEAAYLNGDGTLGAPQYQAIIAADSQMPAASAWALLALARQGMKVVLLADREYRETSLNGDRQAVDRALEAMKALPNVAVAQDEADAQNALIQLGVLPRTQPGQAREQLLSVLRQEGENRYLFLYNREDSEVQTALSLEGLYTPYRLDLWTGDVSALSAGYAAGRTQIDLTLASGDTAVIVLEKREDAAAITVEENTSMDTVALGGWTLAVESWSGGEQKSNSDQWSTEYYYETVKTAIQVPGSMDELIPWDQIEALGAYVSGVGTYETTFTLPQDALGATLDLGPLTGAASVYVNGQDMGPVNLVNPVVDLTDGLQPGENRLQVVYASTLANAVSATAKAALVPGGQSYGLTGTLYVTPYR